MAMRAAASNPGNDAAEESSDEISGMRLRERQRRRKHGGAQVNRSAAVRVIHARCRARRLRWPGRVARNGAHRVPMTVTHPSAPMRWIMRWTRLEDSSATRGSHGEIVEQEIAGAIQHLRRQIARIERIRNATNSRVYSFIGLRLSWE